VTLSAREEILGRIHAALPEMPGDVAASHASIPRLYNRTGILDAHARLDLFIDRLLDYDTEIIQVQTEAELPAAIGLGISIQLDRGLVTAEIDREEAVLTTCEIAIASTGTIILVHHGMQGRRALTLLPDHHLCLVRRNQVVESVPEALEAIAAQSGAPITTISGPSATSDIEMTRIRGVHGPRRLTVILYGSLEAQ